jgi:DNA mismatch endonuclease, patch repair protein
MDRLSQASRSENMRRIRSINTAPEKIIRRLCLTMGYGGYRLNSKKLPGKPDIVWGNRKSAIFINGCFWHDHNCKEGRRKPKSNRNYWLPKIKKNRQRDKLHIQALKEMGWRSLEIWECELSNLVRVKGRIQHFLG